MTMAKELVPGSINRLFLHSNDKFNKLMMWMTADGPIRIKDIKRIVSLQNGQVILQSKVHFDINMLSNLKFPL